MPDQADKQSYRTRLWAVFARHAPSAVILRRGPKNHFHLIAWDLANDSFRHGQWMKGFVRLWDLSPDGRRLLYWAHQYHDPARWQRQQDALSGRDGGADYDPLAAHRRKRSPSKRRKRRKVPRYMREVEATTAGLVCRREMAGVWTALSTPPYFCALAVWPSFGHWTGGGTFLSDSAIMLNEGPGGLAAIENVRRPQWFRVLPNIDTIDSRQWPKFSARHGWMCEPAIYDRVATALAASGVTWLEWVVPWEGGELLFAADGCIYRLANWMDVTPERYLSSARLIADFRDLSFTLVPPPPDAMTWLP